MILILQAIIIHAGRRLIKYKMSISYD